MIRTLRIEPAGVRVEAPGGTSLRELLFPYGIEFPCGGKGTCGRCRVRTESGDTLLACQTRLDSDLVIHIGGWRESVLTEHLEIGPRGSGRGVVVDLGTTTVVAQCIDGATGEILANRAERNEQAAFGADVMTRIEHALTPGGRAELQQCVLRQVRRMVREVSADELPVVIVGNTAMHHLFGGLDAAPLSRAPFEPVQLGELRPDGQVRFLRPVRGFVGSDVLAGVAATGLHRSDELTALLDLGTNGEIVVGNRHGLLCASTAAGPAFEGGRISCGMRAATGAITGVNEDGSVEVAGDGEPRGVCGSGLVDAVACALERREVAASGRILTPARVLALSAGLRLLQADVRELQLAKAAIAAGLEVLTRRLGATVADLRRLYLAGAFGNYVRPWSACRTGLLPFDDERVVPVGNAALAGAKLVLFGHVGVDEIRERMKHVPLQADPEFQDAYVAHITFPLSANSPNRPG